MKSKVVSMDGDSDKDWEAECDANTLIQAESIRGDKKRLKKALAAAKKISTEKQDEAKAAQKVVGKKEMSLIDED